MWKWGSLPAAPQSMRAQVQRVLCKKNPTCPLRCEISHHPLSPTTGHSLPLPSLPISSSSFPIPLKPFPHCTPEMPPPGHSGAPCQEGLGVEQLGGKPGEPNWAAQSPSLPQDPGSLCQTQPPTLTVRLGSRQKQAVCLHIPPPQGRLGGWPLPPCLPQLPKVSMPFSSLCQGAPGISVAGMKVSGRISLRTLGAGWEGKRKTELGLQGLRGVAAEPRRGQIGLRNISLKATCMPLCT